MCSVVVVDDLGAMMIDCGGGGGIEDGGCVIYFGFSSSTLNYPYIIYSYHDLLVRDNIFFNETIYMIYKWNLNEKGDVTI